MSRYVAILAGGSGSRLWPLSRSGTPKQLLTLLGSRSLVQATVDRVRPLVPPERILIVTEASHAEALRAQLPEIPEANVLVEPARRGTAAAVGLAAVVIARRDPAATMASLHSDHIVLDSERFRGHLAAAFDLAESGRWLVALGIRPSSPHTGMGYIEVGPALGAYGGCLAHRAIRFVEKPGLAKAKRFVRQGYVWNSGMFIWTVKVILEEFARSLPATSAALLEAGKAVGTRRQDRAVADAYESLATETIDYGIMERAHTIATIPSDFGWSDVGNWAELLQVGPKDAEGNLVYGEHLGVETHGSVIYGTDRPVFTLGVDDLVIVDLPDALLVCHRAQAERVKQMVEQLQTRSEWAGLI